jgi:phosphoserine phosphatase
MFILDLDDTLIETRKIKDYIFSSLKSVGVSRELAEESYQKARSNGVETGYSFDRHAEVLAEYGFNSIQIVKKLREDFQSLDKTQLLLPGSVELLDWLNSLGERVILTSLGDPEFQKMKIKISGLDSFFQEIILTSSTKIEALASPLKNKKDEEAAWLINDKVGESADLKEKYKDLQVLLKVSPSLPINSYEQSGFPYFKNLIEIKEYVAERIS